MKLDKGAILASMAIIMVASVLVGAGTMAYFNKQVQATGNTFTAGNLDIRLSATRTGGYTPGPITGFWSTPTNWAPGETYTRRLYFKNFGNVRVQVVLLDFTNYQVTSGPSTFWDVIEVDSFHEFVVGMDTNYAPIMATWDVSPFWQYGDNLVPLTLHELMVMIPNGKSGYLNNNDLILFDQAKDDDTDGIPEFYNTYLAPGEVGWLEIGFKFSSTAGIAYEGATCSFDLQMSFIQGPHAAGIEKSDLPGYIT